MEVEAPEEMEMGMMLKSDIGARILVMRVCDINNNNSS